MFTRSLPLLLSVLIAFVSAEIKGPFSAHFAQWLARNNKTSAYALDVLHKYGDTGSFGGKDSDDQEMRHNPVLFIHGNSDSALEVEGNMWATGWNRQIAYFLGKGYSMAELYGLTYGDRNISNSYTRKLNCEDVLGHRRLLESILEYTQAEKVNIISHSMGVSIARLISKGGKIAMESGECDLGESLAHRIDTLLGISGANYGICACEHATMLPACGEMSGFYPGTCAIGICNATTVISQCSRPKYASILAALNHDNRREADHVVSFYSEDDEIIGKSNIVWGRHTSYIPHSDYKKIFTKLKHGEMKTETSKDQYSVIHRHYVA